MDMIAYRDLHVHDDDVDNWSQLLSKLANQLRHSTTVLDEWGICATTSGRPTNCEVWDDLFGYSFTQCVEVLENVNNWSKRWKKHFRKFKLLKRAWQSIPCRLYVNRGQVFEAKQKNSNMVSEMEKKEGGQQKDEHRETVLYNLIHQVIFSWQHHLYNELLSFFYWSTRVRIC